MSDAPQPYSDVETDAEAASRILERLQAMLLRHPLATQAAFRALMAEGRRFARTPEGAVLAGALSRSDLVHRGRMVWDVLTLSGFTEGEEPLPSVLVQELSRVLASEGLEPALSLLFERKV